MEPKMDQSDKQDTLDSEIQTKVEKPKKPQFLLVPK